MEKETWLFLDSTNGRYPIRKDECSRALMDYASYKNTGRPRSAQYTAPDGSHSRSS
jgi:hypothetical protein